MNTPGYNRRVEYKFSTDKNGRKRATYFGSAHRWFPAKRQEAEAHVAQGLADLHTHSDKPCFWCKETWRS